MNEPTPGGANDRRDLVTRRRLLWLGGGAGLGAAMLSSEFLREGAMRGMSRLADTPAPASRTTSPLVRPLEAPPPEVPLVSPYSSTMLCRASWGAAPALPNDKTHVLDHLTIHHTGAVLGDNRNAPERLRQHQRLHQGERGWSDIAYHVGIDRNGNIYELRRPEIVGDTATEYDPTGHFLVLCEGDFDQETVSEAQLHSAALVFAWAAQRYKIPTDTLRGHLDHASTACPGRDLYKHVESGDLRRRVDEISRAGPVSLQEICGPEADAMIAAIKAGQ